jgi:hypothetical protein
MTSSPSTKLRGLVGALALACLVTQGACADLERGPSSASNAGAADGAADDGPDDGGALSFATPVHGLLLAACQMCHATGQQAGDTQLLLVGDAAADYAVVMPFVDVMAPGSSRLLAKMSGQGHGGGTVYAADSAAYQTILKWIQQGARP